MRRIGTKIKNGIIRVKGALGLRNQKLQFRDNVNPDGSYRVPGNVIELIIERVNKFRPEKSFQKFGMNELLFRRSSDIGGRRRISDSVHFKICAFMQNKNSHYQNAVSRCVAYVDKMDCTGIVWYQPDPEWDNEDMKEIIQALSKVYYLYNCSRRPKNKNFTIEDGCTYVKEDNVYIFTFNNDAFENWDLRRAPRSSAFILRMKTRSEAIRALKPNSAILKNFIYFSSENASDENYKYRLDDDLLEVYLVSPKPKLTLKTKDNR